jgi:hypothetical protein
MAMRDSRNSQKPGNGQYRAAHRSTAAGSTRKETDDLEQREASESDGLKLALKQFRELGEYFSYYVTAKADIVKLSLWAIALRVVLAALAFVTGAALIISASWLVLSGVAQGLGVLFGDRLWAGNMTTGLLVLAALALGVYCAVSKIMKISRERTIQKYEERQALQRKEFGRDVCDQAAATTSETR